MKENEVDKSKSKTATYSALLAFTGAASAVGIASLTGDQQLSVGFTRAVAGVGTLLNVGVAAFCATKLVLPLFRRGDTPDKPHTKPPGL